MSMEKKEQEISNRPKTPKINIRYESFSSNKSRENKPTDK